MSRLWLTILLSVVLVLLPVGNSNAAPKNSYATSKAEAAQIAKQRYGGKVLKVDKITRNAHAYYRVKLLSKKGKVHIITIGTPKNKRG